MKKLMIIWLSCLVNSYCFGQDFCRYLYDEKICYEMSVSKMLLQSLTLTIEDFERELQNTVAGNLWYALEIETKTFLVEMHNTSKENMLELQRQWRAREDVDWVSPISQEEGYDFGYTHHVDVRLKSVEDYPVLLACAEAYHITEINYLYSDKNPLVYVLTLPHNSEKDASVVANELHETGLFVHASFNPITLFPYGGPSSTQIHTGDESYFLYPNPSKDFLYVDLEKKVHTQNTIAASFDIRLYCSQGKMLRQTKAAGGTVQFDVSNIPGGIYFLHVYNGMLSTPQAFKIIINH